MSSPDRADHAGGGCGDLLDRIYSVALRLADPPDAERAVEHAYAATDPGQVGDERRIALYRAMISSLPGEAGGTGGPGDGAPVADAVRALPEADRVPVLLADVEGLSSRQLARVLDTPADELCDTVARAHLRLFDTLSGDGAGPFRPAARAGARRADGSSRPWRPAARGEGGAGC